MTKRFVIICLFFSQFNFACFAQVNEYTNVELKIWQKDYLKTVRFQNGDKLEICKDTNEWKSVNLKNRPAVFIKDNRNHYYNYSAISDPRRVCPSGSRIPMYFEISEAKIELYSENKKINKDNLDLILQPVGLLDYSDGAVQLLNENSRNLFLSTLSKWHDEPLYYQTSAHISKDNEILVEEWPMTKNSGLPVICIADMDKLLSDSIFDYKQLLPNTYHSMLDKMVSVVKTHFSPMNDFKVSIIGSVKSSKNGNIESYLSNVESSTLIENYTMLKQSLNSALSELNTIPYFKGNILMAQSEIDLIISQKINTSLKKIINSSSEIELHNVEKRNLEYALENGFKAELKSTEIELIESNTVLKTMNLTNVSQFNAPGILNSAAALLPGMGLTFISKNSLRWKPLAKTILISSVSLGIISISSKIYSNKYYNEYKADIFGVNSYYRKANISQKIFLSSLIGYGALAVLDFGLTYTIGTKNKIIQFELNSELRNGKTIILN